jgi:hypothetical protein
MIISPSKGDPPFSLAIIKAFMISIYTIKMPKFTEVDS